MEIEFLFETKSHILSAHLEVKDDLKLGNILPVPPKCKILMSLSMYARQAPSYILAQELSIYRNS